MKKEWKDDVKESFWNVYKLKWKTGASWTEAAWQDANDAIVWQARTRQFWRKRPSAWFYFKLFGFDAWWRAYGMSYPCQNWNTGMLTNSTGHRYT
jgi:hypothetical protein